MTKYFVYCLISEGEIIYIGSSTKLLNRIRTHTNDKKFDTVRYCQLLDRKTMLDYEIYAINKVKPPLNRVMPLPSMLEAPKNIQWRKADLSFLHRNRVDIYYRLEQNIWWEYLNTVCEKLSILNIDPYSEWGLTYTRVRDKIVAVFDGTDLSLEALATEEGIVSYYEYMTMKYDELGMISANQYERSLTQFD